MLEEITPSHRRYLSGDMFVAQEDIQFRSDLDENVHAYPLQPAGDYLCCISTAFSFRSSLPLHTSTVTFDSLSFLGTHDDGA